MEEQYNKKNPVTNRHRGKIRERTEFTERQKVKGVTFFLHDRGYKDLKDAHLIIKHYCLVNKIILPARRPIMVACIEIQKDFPKFLKFVNENYNKPRHGKSDIYNASDNQIQN